MSGPTITRYASSLRAPIAALALAACVAHPPAYARDVCAGVPDRDVEAGPFARVAIVAVAEIVDQTPGTKIPMRRVRGASIVVRGAPGQTRASLAVVAQCHAARATAPDDPLAGGVDVDVIETEAGYAVTVVGTSERQGVEILRRARVQSRLISVPTP